MTAAALPDLPVSATLPALLAALEARASAVLVAPPGAGKTTLVPLALLAAPWLETRTILLLEPRRLAARAAAHRMADLLGEAVGGTVGYAMRMDHRLSARTRILVVTEGVLARTILDDPELTGVGAVLFDEFHERSLDGDFGLALALDVQGALRPDLRLLVMSATLDGARVAALMDGAPVLRSEGRGFPVDVRYRERAPGAAVEDAVASAVREALAGERGGVLAFLPGSREIERTRERLSAAGLPQDTDLAVLHGSLDGRAQDLAVRPAAPGRRKVVLATAIAETSLTIEGVRVVVDCGLSRLPRFEPATGLTRLETVRASRASADQRAGRAGRTQPGVAVRLWRAEQTAALPPFTPPEILDADLAGLTLDCAAWGVADPRRLRFLDPPPLPALAEARSLLTALGALDGQGRPTEAGVAMRGLALPVRLAHMVAEAAKEGQADAAARLAVLLTERGLGGDTVDLDRRLERFSRESGPRAEAARTLARRLAKQAVGTRQGSENRRSEVQNGQGRQGRQGAGDMLAPGGGGQPRMPLEREPPAAAGPLLLHAWPDRVAKARGERGRFLLANGRGSRLDAADPLAGSPFLVVADLQGTAANARIASAAVLGEADLFEALGRRIGRDRETVFDAATGTVRVVERTRLGAITLTERLLPRPSGAEADRAIADALRAHGLGLLPWSDGAQALRDRLAWLHATFGAPWPAVGDDALLAALDDWLAPFLSGQPSLQSLGGDTLSRALLSRLPYEGQQLADWAPTHWEAPTGSRLPIRYAGGAPVLAVRVQELFGLDRHPAIAGDRVPLTLELLSPAHRPIQTTRDLPGFWRGSWRDVRADLRGRYPRHPWPEDPLSAPPTARAKPRGS